MRPRTWSGVTSAFHVFFILMAILISLAFAAWVFALAPVGQVSFGLQTLGAFSGLAGYVLAFFYEFPVGAMQTAVAAALALLGVTLHLLRHQRTRVAPSQ